MMLANTAYESVKQFNDKSATYEFLDTLEMRHPTLIFSSLTKKYHRISHVGGGRL